MTPTITAFKASPDKGQGLARDMRVRWAFEEVGQAYDVRLVTFAEMKAPQHLALSPFGQIPTCEEGELALFESGAIVLHVAERHAGLLPKDPGGRARAIAWMLAALSTIEPPILDLETAVLLEADKPWAGERLPQVKDRIRTRPTQLSDRLGGADWLDGDFSAGDLMMVHESQPGYLDKLTALDLSGGDKTGMWILNYAFPYERPDGIAAFDTASVALADAMEARGKPEFTARFDAYLAARAAFSKTVSAADWRYFDFQLWQEGTARRTEIAVSAADPDAEVAAPSGRLEKATLAALRHQDLTVRKREVVYAFGAGEAMLMEACGPQWRKAYFDQLAMGPLLLAARARCGT
jgi:glutathione S-transferase